MMDGTIVRLVVYRLGTSEKKFGTNLKVFKEHVGFQLALMMDGTIVRLVVYRLGMSEKLLGSSLQE